MKIHHKLRLQYLNDRAIERHCERVGLVFFATVIIVMITFTIGSVLLAD